MKILIGTKAGGHSIETLGIIKHLLKEYYNPQFYIITENTDKLNYNFYFNVNKIKKTISWRNPTKKFINPFYVLKNFFDSYFFIRKVNPDLIICNGANTSLLLGLLGKKWFKKKVIAVESLNRVNVPSKAPKLLSKYCDGVWIPHKELKGNYNGKEKYIGFYHPFIEMINELKGNKKIKDRLVVSSIAKNKLKKTFDKPLLPIELLEIMSKTRTLITNAGITAWEGAELCDRVIVYPLIPSAENHQEEFAKWLSKKYKNVEVKNG